MLALSKFFVVALAVSTQTAFAAHRSFGRRHHDIAIRNAEAFPQVQPIADDVIVKPRRNRRRSDSSRCKASSASSSEVASSTSVQQATTAIVNVGASPDTTSTQQAQPTTSSTHTQEAQHTSSSTQEAATTQQATSTHQETTQQATTSTSSASTATGTQSYLTGTQSGEGTFYDIGLGACGITNSGDDKIAAVSYLLFDTYPGYDGTNSNNNPICGKSVTATYGGKSVTVQITDRCTGCALTDLDFSPSAFTELADESVGRITGMTWVWD